MPNRKFAAIFYSFQIQLKIPLVAGDVECKIVKCKKKKTHGISIFMYGYTLCSVVATFPTTKQCMRNNNKNKTRKNPPGENSAVYSSSVYHKNSIYFAGIVVVCA